MYVASVRAELHLPHAQSLKDKRQVMNRVKDRLRATHAAVSEVDHADKWQRSALGMAVVTGDPRGLDEMLQSLRDIVERVPEIVVLDWIVRHHESPS
jgi:uncharacterized protein YlxP (DUF503 family)